MNDEELEEYIKKVEPNFDYNAHTGTIEMSNEYYNLLEEKMTRLINKNKQLQQERDKYKSNAEKLEKIILELYEENKDLLNHFAIDKLKELEEGEDNES